MNFYIAEPVTRLPLFNFLVRYIFTEVLNFPICIRIRSGVERVQGTFLSPDECMSIKVKEDVVENNVNKR